MAPVIPAALAAGESFETRFAVPAPRLGPPTAHLGEAIVAWALEVRWDIAMGDDAFVATFLPVAQHPDLIRAGVAGAGRHGAARCRGRRWRDDLGDDAAAGRPGLADRVRAAWPGAPGGPARIELHRRTNAPNGVEGVVAVAATDSDALRAGSARGHAPGPGRRRRRRSTAPTWRSSYVVRVLVDRRLQPDAAVERPVAIA